MERRRRISLLLAAAIGSSCAQTSLRDLPLWRVEIDSAGREVRLVSMPFAQASFDMRSHQLVRLVEDRNEDGFSDRVTTYAGLGGARAEETDTNFDGATDRWDTYDAEGRRLRSASATHGVNPDRIATFAHDGSLTQVEIDANLDGRFEITRTYEGGKVIRALLDADGNGTPDRTQDFRDGYLGYEDIDADEDGVPEIRIRYFPNGTPLRVEMLRAKERP